MWGQIIAGTAQAALGFLGAKSAAKQQARYARQMAEYRSFLRGGMEDNKQLALRMLMAEQADETYKRDQQRFRDMLMMNAREYEKGRIRETLDQLQAERFSDIDRQRRIDSAAMQDRMYEINQILQNSNLSVNERRFAEHQMRRMEDRLLEERDYEQMMHDTLRAQATDERTWRIEELREDERQADEERQAQKAIQDQYFGAVDQFSDEISRVRDSLGDVPARQTYGEADVQRVYERNMADMMPGWRAALTAATSAGEADIIRRGIGTDGGDNNARRAEIASRMSTALSSLQGQARQAAMSEIMNYQQNEDARVAHELNKRGLLLGEAEQATVPQIGMIGQAPALQSAILDRDVGTAMYTGLPATSLAHNQWQNIPSALYDRMPGLSSLGSTLNKTSAVTTMMPNSSPFATFHATPDRTSAASIYNQSPYLTAIGNTFQQPSANPATGMSAAGKGIGKIIENVPWDSWLGRSTSNTRQPMHRPWGRYNTRPR